jgi:hypothetical protein
MPDKFVGTKIPLDNFGHQKSNGNCEFIKYPLFWDRLNIQLMPKKTKRLFSLSPFPKRTDLVPPPDE